MQTNSYITDRSLDILAISRGYASNDVVYTFGKSMSDSYLSLVGNTTTYGISTSTNVKSWSPMTNTSATNTPSRVVWDGVKWLITGKTASVYSYNGETFDNMSSSSALSCVEYNTRIYVGIGTGGVFFSYDGIHWNNSSSGTGLLQAATPPTSQIGKVAWNGTIWIAVGFGDSYTIIYSSDGIQWYPVANSKTIFNASTGATDIVWNGTIWIATGTNTAGKLAAISSDGMTWANVSGLGL